MQPNNIYCTDVLDIFLSVFVKMAKNGVTAVLR